MDINKYNKFIAELDIYFGGLPFAASSLRKSLVLLADFESGLVQNITYRDLSKILTIDPAPGRKNSGAPKKQTIRSYLRTIEKQFPNDFKVISEGQQLKLQFITLPQNYRFFIGKTDVYTDEVVQSNSQESLGNIDESRGFKGHVSPESSMDECISETSIYNKHNSNKQTSCDEKLPISKNFYPSAHTIQNAQEQGFIKVTDPEEIKAFIEHNQDQESRWEDFNPIFLRWLGRCFSHKPKQKKQAVRTKRKLNDEQNNTNDSEFDSGSEMLDDITLSWIKKIESSKSGRVHDRNAC